MPKTTDENEKVIEKNLEYIGLNLEKIPKFLTEFEPLNFRALKSYDEKIYKVYRYIDVKDIEILITPTDRLTDLKEKYKLASPIFTYLDSKNEEEIEKFATFLKMISNLDVDRMEEIEEEQKKIKEKLPYKVKYKNHFIWQIYYSDDTKKYFMLAPTKEKDNNALFYLLKKQIASKKSRRKERIFVPISHLEYSGRYLSKAEISDIENYLWYFTKEWPSVYEVYDEKDNMSIRIVGEANVYEKIKSSYCINVNTKEEAIEIYKLLKAMFILATGAQEEYHFETKISERGSLQFYNKEKLLTYSKLAEYINQEYDEKIETIKKEIKEKAKLEKRLKRFNILVEELTQEYLGKQRQIATFLECKKTFFGKVKYFFKKKKEVVIAKKPEKLRDRDEKKEDELSSFYEEKEQYTIEDLINICTVLQKKKKETTNLNLDIKAIESKKDILAKKIENAELYIKEIDKHKKSIFEFWKFTSKDEVQTLNEGEEVEENKKDGIQKYFNYETDLEDLGKIIDELQRRKLSKNETDAMFAAKQALKSIRALKNKEEEKSIKKLEEGLEILKEEYKNNLEYINIKDFNIFGSLSEDKTKIKTIRNQKHREIEKDKYKVLNINSETTLDVYIDNLQHYLNLINESLNKICSPYKMSIYQILSKNDMDGIHVFDINPTNALLTALEDENDDITLCRINLRENTPVLFYTNIIYYDNFNKTLPVGMDLSTEVLFNIDKVELKYIKEKEFNINYCKDEFNMITKFVKIHEYEVNLKMNLENEKEEK